MKFELAYDLRNPQLDGLRRLPDLYAQTLEQNTYAEELGFDDVWVSERHMKDDDYMPSTTAFCAAIAARTQRVGIGTFMADHALAPFDHQISWAVWPGMDVSLATSSLELIAARVVPALRDLGEETLLSSAVASGRA